jgi:hypothetical protein
VAVDSLRRVCRNDGDAVRGPVPRRAGRRRCRAGRRQRLDLDRSGGRAGWRSRSPAVPARRLRRDQRWGAAQLRPRRSLAGTGGGWYPTARPPSRSIRRTRSSVCRTDGGGVFRTSDGGESWRAANGSTTPALASATIGAVVVDPLDSRILYAATRGVGLFKSTTAGDAWFESDDGITTAFLLTLAIDPHATGTLYAGTVDGVFRSTDGGQSWEPASDGLTDTFVRALAVDPTASGRLYAATPAACSPATTAARVDPASNGLESLASSRSPSTR